MTVDGTKPDVEEALLSQLRKIAVMAERGGTPEEAATAAAMLQKLMLKHQLDMEDLRPPTENPYQRYGHKFHEGYGQQWSSILLNALAKGHNCRCVRVSENGRLWKWDVIGEQTMVWTVIRLHKTLVTLLRNLARIRYGLYKTGEIKEGRFNVMRRAVYYRSYLEGAVMTIHTRLAETRDSLNSTALIVLDDRAEKVKNKLYPSLRTTRSRMRQVDGRAYAEGRRDGTYMPVRTAASGGSRTRPLRIGGTS